MPDMENTLTKQVSSGTLTLPEHVNVLFLQTVADKETENGLKQRLPTLMAAYRMTTHKTTGMTPNMAMLGREVALPASLTAKPPDEPLEPKVPFVKDFSDTLRNAHKRVRDAMHSSAKTEKSYYDKLQTRSTFLAVLA